MSLISDAYAQAAPAVGGAAGGLMSLLPITLMFVVSWPITIRPQTKCQKETKAMFEALVKGGEVVTAGGILDKVNKVAEQYITVEIAVNTEITVQKSAVTTVLPKDMLKVL